MDGKREIRTTADEAAVKGSFAEGAAQRRDLDCGGGGIGAGGCSRDYHLCLLFLCLHSTKRLQLPLMRNIYNSTTNCLTLLQKLAMDRKY